MSLKAKLEAVIYAAEEPVSLAQLAALFAADALEWKAAQETAAAEQAAEIAGDAPENAEPAPLLSEELQCLTSEGETGVPAQASELAPGDRDLEAAENPELIAGQPPEAEPPAGGEPLDTQSDARSQARQRDREIKGVIKQLLDELIVSYASDDRGVEIREIAGGYRMATKPECHDAVRTFVKTLKPPLKLSLPALETLAVVAYKQPVTAPELNEIRGVESGGVLGSLLARKLIATAGRKQVIGRPILYKTTREFLLRFGLKDLSELPSMEEFEKMAAAEIEEMEPEAAAADAAEAPSGDMVEESAEKDAASLERNSPSGDEMASESERSPERSEAGEETASPLAKPAASSEKLEATKPEPTPAEWTPAETEAVSHGHQEEDEH